MKTKWEAFCKQIEKSDTELSEFLTYGGMNSLSAKKAEKFIKEWNTTKKLIDEIDNYIMVVEPLENKIPFKSTVLAEMWQRWKDYINEQHGQVMKSRSERSAMEHLLEIAKGDEEKAVKYLRYAMTNRYKNFFAIEEKDTKQPDKRERKGSSFDED